jgi:hypothetical protein
MDGRTHFHMEINSIEEFIILCGQIRNEPIDPAVLQALAARLSTASDELAAAEAAAK